MLPTYNQGPKLSFSLLFQFLALNRYAQVVIFVCGWPLMILEQLSRSGCPRGWGHCDRLSEFVGSSLVAESAMDTLLGDFILSHGWIDFKLYYNLDLICIFVELNFLSIIFLGGQFPDLIKNVKVSNIISYFIYYKFQFFI